MSKGVVDIVCGSVVLANAGRDKGSMFVAVESHDGFVYIADGRERRLMKPKRKNPKHISPVGMIINMQGLSNKKLRKLINELETQTDFQQTLNLDGEVF